jgi:hypothetical protein
LRRSGGVRAPALLSSALGGSEWPPSRPGRFTPGQRATTPAELSWRSKTARKRGTCNVPPSPKEQHEHAQLLSSNYSWYVHRRGHGGTVPNLLAVFLPIHLRVNKYKTNAGWVPAPDGVTYYSKSLQIKDMCVLPRFICSGSRVHSCSGLKHCKKDELRFTVFIAYRLI